MRLVDCDSSDMTMWCSTPCAENVLRELREWRQAADKTVHSKLSERAAGEHDAYSRVIRIFEGFLK